MYIQWDHLIVFSWSVFSIKTNTFWMVKTFVISWKIRIVILLFVEPWGEQLIQCSSPVDQILGLLIIEIHSHDFWISYNWHHLLPFKKLFSVFTNSQSTNLLRFFTNFLFFFLKQGRIGKKLSRTLYFHKKKICKKIRRFGICENMSHTSYSFYFCAILIKLEICWINKQVWSKISL